jgi:hypothetical protein
MGVLDLLCVTTDLDATTFFGLAYAEDYSSTDVKPQYVVLVKSNTNPSSPTDLAWSVLSKFDGSKLKGYPGSVNGVDTSCTITARGVFTMVGRYKATSSPVDVMANFGIRYDPTALMDNRIEFDGPGVWMNISIADGYHYSGDFTRRSLGYISNGALVHFSLSDTSNTITLATINETTLTLEPTTVWILVNHALTIIMCLLWTSVLALFLILSLCRSSVQLTQTTVDNRTPNSTESQYKP